MKFLLKLLIKRTEEKHNSNGVKYYQPLLDKLKSNDSDISDWLKEQRHSTLFSYAKPELLLETLTNAGPKIIMDNYSWMKTRVMEANYNSGKAEKPFWDKFKKLIIEYLKTARITTTTYAFKCLLREVYAIDKDELETEIKAPSYSEKVE